MRLYPPMYPGDSFLEPGTAPGSDAPWAWETVAFRAHFVRSNMPAEAAPEAGVDVAAIERQASAAQSLADLDERIHRYQHMQSRHC